jgi:hypothetical protein
VTPLAQPVGNFDANTRQKIVQLPTLTKGLGSNTQQTQLPKTGILAGIYLQISATVAGGLSAPNAAGASSIVRRVRLFVNSGITLIDISGPGYGYLLNESLESEYFLAQGQYTGRSAVTPTSFDLSMYLPISVNLRDAIGAFMLQNEQTIVTLAIDFEQDATVATGATVTATVKPYLILFTVPVNQADWPPFNVVHQILEDQQAVGAGQVTYPWPRGNTYLSLSHGLGIGAAGSDGFTQVAIRLNQSDYLQNTDAAYLDVQHRLFRGRARPAGAAIFDFLASSGTGNYGKTRDVVNSARVTDISTVLTSSGANTLYSLRRQLVVLRNQQPLAA